MTRGATGRSRRSSEAGVDAGPRHGLARVLSKAGLCSRSQAAQMVREGRVSLAGRVLRDPEFPITARHIADIRVDGAALPTTQARYFMLNKPRGLLTTTRDEQGRDTVYRCFDGHEVGWIAPVGRLDKASEGLLLMSNDPQWAAAITDPERGPDKTYHVQVEGVPTRAQLQQMVEGVLDDGELFAAKSVQLLRSGGKTAWLQVVLDEGRNRQIRRILGALDLPVKRLLRVAIGPLQLGGLGKGQWRELDAAEVAALTTLR